MEKTIHGIAASSGIAIAKAYRLETPHLAAEKRPITDAEAEVARLEAAVAKAKEELEMIKQHALEKLGEDKAAIFAAHLLVLDDPELLNPIKEKIKTEQVNAEYALDETASFFISMFEGMDNEYMKERAADIRDVTKRVLAHLLGVAISNPSLISEEVVIIAEDLTPSDTAQLNRQYVKGFATDIGGRTSHSAIMARSLEIPAVVGTKTVTAEVKNGDIVVIDGLDGQVVVNPSPELLAHYEEKQARYEAQKAEWAKLVHEPTVTADGVHVELAANIGTPDDVKGVLANGAEGIGLYRTEFLYMGRPELPTEEEQFVAYKTVLEQMKGKPVVVRTLDIGGDKELPYLNLPKEMNPFLGFRAIRLCLEMQEMFRTQLRALLRASVHGNLKIMFPMIATLDEFRQAKAILLEEKEALLRQGTPVADDIEVGMMVEIPAAAVMADQFAKEVDFFSIGTNDLIQYTMAADRMNERVSYLYQPYNPAILRLISHVIDAAHREGKWVGMCGEMAGDPIAIPILLALGLDEFSMSATSILPARAQLKQLSKEEATRIKEKVLSLGTAEDVVAFVKQTFSLA
ncbi:MULTISPECIES: phosphoenolpyruvate--protein phosphotransferase [Geobacillus]|jgi:phosphoenolpyruvate-protein phosphotransferase (PTS system enzyme I)|uniref:Phosphoenolpyruvate-protein phosphotransferase n=1 Tax=Geobacillus thermodenitrificans TaxID=33940 RepID=A0ABY9QEA1_GEOTD|nr:MULTISPECIES: phosphoenolpyruvate--protein phosphotransferase [Geobacillus]ARA97341.1 phosphoenolpyruvate--protein phosphotransferase [Geobacillus thermodenitrificans]ARP42015.1 Phosphoenolpyruvate-protein phosphotransferase [Geobacillus thermodenitrificans]ATO36639.1 phosphoenolpyruvate--protein phosphotransferase [Geobacillus thermodenitrificans]KQB94084.1 Phosphoenolpyruvate-protein phosphotransferase [Geobacillus sp. PA-3]MED0663855.1 phosphoenolpyruvate--protein phosphotransferase [Geo